MLLPRHSCAVAADTAHAYARSQADAPCSPHSQSCNELHHREEGCCVRRHLPLRWVQFQSVRGTGSSTHALKASDSGGHWLFPSLHVLA